MSINTEMTALADAIRAKSGTSGKLSISGMTTAVNNIVINAGDDIDLSGVTVTADKMLSGIVAVGATGEKVTGNIQTVTATSNGTTVTVPVGYIASEQTFDVGSDGYDTSSVTVTSAGMLAGLVAIGKNGETITGTIPTVTASVSGDKVTVPVGYIATEQTFDVGGSGIDTTTSVPPSAADVRLGKEFFANGAKYTGTMPDAVVSTETLDGGDIDTRLTITAGYLENDFTIEYLSSGFTYLPFITATAADIREGMVGADAEGNPITGTLVVGGEAPASSTPAIAKVTEYTPYSPAFSGITEVNVSGIGMVGEEDYGEDYSDANGKYIVTDATYYEADENKRVYKHETKNYWLMCYDDTENYWYDGCIYWLITEYETDSDPYSSIVCVAEDTLPVGMSEWYNYNYDTPVDVGTATTHTDKPEQPLVLKGQMASAYDFSDYGWIFPETITDFSGFDVEPKNGELFSVVDGRLIGGTLGFNPAEMEGNAVVYSNYGNSTGAVPQGIVLPYSRKTVVSGVPCVWFDTDAASDGIGTRESWAYLPLSKTLNFYSEQAQTQPVPFNTFSIIGTMFCETWGNTGSGGFRVTNKLDLSSYGERPSWDGIGVHFDPNYGFTIAGGWGHPSDYKKYYNAYNGKWAQFALIVDGYTAKLYINGELRVEACNFDYGSSNPAEIKYLCFRQPNDLYSTVYFGKMYVFDRVLSNSEIARAYKTLQSMELPPFTGLPDGYKFRASFSNSVSAETGQALSVTGNPEITTKNGVPCAYFDGTVEISTQLDIDSWTDGVSHIAISAWIKIDPAQYENIRSICGFEQAGYHLIFSKDNAYCSSEWMHILMQSSYGKIITDDPNFEASHHCEIWINGFKASEQSLDAWGVLLNTFGIGNYPNSGKERFTGHIAEVIVYNRALRDSEIKQLAAQYAKKTVAGGEDEW